VVATYIATLQCVDAPGIVRAASSAIFDIGGNILENDQFTDPVTNQFCMRSRFESSEAIEVIRTRLRDELVQFSPALHLRDELVRRRALVMVSQYEHCLAELLYRRSQGDLPLDIVAVVSNHANCGDLARRYDVAFHEIAVSAADKVSAEAQALALIRHYDVDFVILARYMQILSPELCLELSGQIVNIHHSFLPGFVGARPYHQAFKRGVKLIGATAHFVTPELDQGPIIEQDVVRVTHARGPDDLVSLGRDIERNVLFRAVHLMAEDRVALVGDRTVIFTQ
jgi:formyltetrahydrofolate deformylase